MITPPPLVFGPVPSRRLGRSLGINNVPPKTCSYSCVYCQVGPTGQRLLERRTFHSPEEVVCAVIRRVQALREAGERVDFLTFVPDGEPTLDEHLGEEIERLGTLGLPVAVVTNGSMLWREEVRVALHKAEWVSLKVDAGEDGAWRRLNRPHAALGLDQLLDGLVEFAAGYHGELATETMLVRGVNDSPAAIEAVAAFLARLRPDVAYVAVPTRPPSEGWVRPPDEAAVTLAHERFARSVPRVELLVGWEGSGFSATGDAEHDLLSITAVHPLRADAAAALLARDQAGSEVLDALVADGRLRPVEYEGRRFYVRRFAHPSGTLEGSEAGG
jgi:wyosine [tRNA(Phe)-imidazoG37] synthetase (radical SAM superfamily)